MIRLVLRESLILTATGVGIGLLLSWGVAKALARLLYEVSSLDPIVFAVAPVVLVGAAILAAYVPARRATRIQPLAALRTEDLLKERAGRADWRRVQAILDRVGTEPPQAGDELPE